MTTGSSYGGRNVKADSPAIFCGRCGAVLYTEAELKVVSGEGDST